MVGQRRTSVPVLDDRSAVALDDPAARRSPAIRFDDGDITAIA